MSSMVVDLQICHQTKHALVGVKVIVRLQTTKMLTLKVDLQPLALRHVTVFSSQLLLHGELQKVKGH